MARSDGVRIAPDILLRIRSDDGVEVGVRQVERVRGTDAELDPLRHTLLGRRPACRAS